MRRILLALFAALGLALGSGTALAQHSGGGHSGGGHSGGWSGGGHSGGWHGGGWHGGHGHGGSHFVWGVGIGFPGYWGYPYYGYPYYASYPYYGGYPYYADEPYYGVYDPAPGSYIQRDMGSAPSSSAPAGENQYSYYCPDPAGYYPQIQSCAKGWLKVVPDGGPRPRPR
jgi:hypothetical protein